MHTGYSYSQPGYNHTEMLLLLLNGTQPYRTAIVTGNLKIQPNVTDVPFTANQDTPNRTARVIANQSRQLAGYFATK